MSTLFGEESPASGTAKKVPGVVDDFMYSTNVAGSHLYIRMGFLRKVYGILSAQLLMTTLVATLFISFEPLADFIKANQWILMVTVMSSFVLLLALMFKSRDVPANYILLGLFTFVESIMVGVIVTMYTVSSVIQAFALTAAVTVALTVYAFQTKRDYTHWGAALFSCVWILIMAGFMQLFMRSEWMDVGISVAGAVVFSLFIIFDTQMIMQKVSPEEYIHAAINLYLDILNLFLYILRILGERKN